MDKRRRVGDKICAPVILEQGLKYGHPRPFKSLDEMLELGLTMLTVRQAFYEAVTGKNKEQRKFSALRQNAQQWTKFWHRSFQMSKDTVPLASYLLKARLNRMEREIVLVLMMKHLALISCKIETGGEVVEQIAVTPIERLKAMRLLGEGNRLRRHGLVAVNDDDEPPPKQEVYLDPFLAQMAMNPEATPFSGWPVKSEAALHDYMHRLARAFQQKAEEMERLHRGYGDQSSAQKWHRAIANLTRGLENTLHQHPDWKLATLQKAFEFHGRVRMEEWTILLILMCKELGHVSADDDLFRGIGLIRAACTQTVAAHRSLHLLGASSRLRAGQWIQPCGGSHPFMSDDAHDLQETEYELTKKALDALGLAKGTSKANNRRYELITARITLSDLVLAAETTQSLEQAVAQASHTKVMFDAWGLGERICYGRGVTLMFYGPPGTGKTAAAQALAHALDRQLLVADYSRIQNCFVGQTEKNIMRIFREAREHEAVLFWDEADAMFFDRAAATHSWEVRDINVLLQELERFEGACILATNRMTVLDKALERRISLKVKFDRPDRQARLEIFRRMIPEKMPLAADVDLDALAAADLSGGEIKNVILNAARSALARDGAKATVCMADFRHAIRGIAQGAWTRRHEREIGFNK